jgi:DNA (cytosine-5)-methyltransferase 1
MVGSLKFIDIFAGCGGISLGLLNSGLTGVFAIEKNPDAFETYSHNLLGGKFSYEWPNWLSKSNHDISDVISTYKNRLVDYQGKIDLMVGGPPCQGFSIAGLRQSTDKRNQLIHCYIDLVRIIKPRILLFENVRGFTQKFSTESTNEKPYSEIVINDLIDLGYQDAQGNMFNFYEYGIPQRRQRYIVIATLDGRSDEILGYLHSNVISFLKQKDLPQHNSSHDAISDLEMKNGTIYCPDSVGFFSGKRSNETTTTYQQYISGLQSDNFYPDSHRFVNHTPEIANLFKLLQQHAPRGIAISGKEKQKFGIKKRSLTILEAKNPSPTLTTIPDDIIHYSEPRVLTVREYARLQAFPDWFEFKGPYTTGTKKRKTMVPRYSQVGNAVPPLFAEQLGIAISHIYGK